MTFDYDEWIAHITEVPEDKLRLLGLEGARERTRRETQAAGEQAQAEVVKELQDAGKLPLPDALTDAEKLPENANDVPEWVNPGTDHSMMYREGDIVRYGDRIVRSTHKGLNSWEPGALGFDGRIWEDITPAAAEEDPTPEDTPEDTPAPFVPPTGAHDAYAKGTRVLFEGKVYESILDGNTYSPADYPAGWKQVEE